MSRARALASIAVIVSCLGCDQVTKSVAVERLAGEPPLDYLGGAVRLVYAENRGAFLGLGNGWPEPARAAVLVGVTTAILAWAAWSLLRGHARGRLEHLGLLLLVAGGAGNLVDRVSAGYVVDFMNVGLGRVRTGIFNVADVVLMVGVGALLVGALRAAPPAEESSGA